MRTHQLLLVPSIRPDFASRCVRSFARGLARTDSLALVAYNGHDSNVDTRWLDERAILLGFSDTAWLADHLSGLGGCRPALLFGDTKHGRGYGGGSNLLLALARVLRCHTAARVDDDTLNHQVNDRCWLRRAFSLRPTDTVYSGSTVGEPSNLAHQLPTEISAGLGSFFYDSNDFSRKTGHGWGGTGLKNGVLVFAPNWACLGSYPVLHDERTGINLRGEIYCWRDELRLAGADVAHHTDLALRHDPEPGRSPASWLRTTLAGFDFWHSRASALQSGAFPPRIERVAELERLRQWIRRTEWPDWIDAEDLLWITSPDEALSLAERLQDERSERAAAWSRIMSANLGTVRSHVLAMMEARS